MKIRSLCLAVGTGLLGLASIARIEVAIPAAAEAAAPREIQIVAKRFAYIPGEITVKKGEPVVLELTTQDVTHGLKFSELNLDVEIRKNQTATLAFTPDRTGTFVGHCSHFCGIGHGSMTLIMHIVE
jgi:cytochrome c oxidase subunit II